MRAVRARLAAERRERVVRATRPIDTIKRRIPGRTPGRTGTKLCLMAHFDGDGRVAPYVLNYIDQLRQLGFDVVLASTSPFLDERDVPKLQERCRLAIIRENVGLDFGSWGAAMTALEDFGDYEELLLTNDSVFGPIVDLRETLERIASFPEALCGLTDNWEKQYHLQSYFLYFKRPALRSPTFERFWREFRLSTDKERIIIEYEVGISQAFIRDDVRIRPCFRFNELRDHCLAMGDAFQYRDLISRQPVNPTIFLWDVLIRDFRFPFLKTEILKINRFQSRSVVNWRKSCRPARTRRST